MNKVIQFFMVLVICQSSVWAQSNINEYKYILIPKQFEFQRTDDQYQLNSLSKFLFNKYGFEAYFENEDLPSDVSQNRCLALKADLKKLKGFLITRLQFELSDCNGTIVSTSKVGETKVKQYDTAYNIALRQAFETYQNMNYSYEPKDRSSSPVVATKEAEIKRDIEPEVKEQKTTIETNDKSEDKVEEQIVVAEAKTPVETKTAETKSEPASSRKEDTGWYAKPIDNGYEVLDASKNNIMILLYSGATDVYIVKDENAIVFKKDGYWMYSSNNGSGIRVNRIDLKF